MLWRPTFINKPPGHNWNVAARPVVDWERHLRERLGEADGQSLAWELLELNAIGSTATLRAGRTIWLWWGLERCGCFIWGFQISSNP